MVETVLNFIFSRENFRFFLEFGPYMLLAVGVAITVIALTRSSSKMRNKTLIGGVSSLVLAVFLQIAKHYNWLPDVPEVATPSPAKIEIATVTTNITSHGITEKINITNTSRSKRQVTVSTVIPKLSVSQNSSEASSFRGHGPASVNELVVVHGKDGLQRVFNIGSNGKCSKKITTSNNLLDALESPINIVLEQGETYSFVVHNVAESPGTFTTSWEVKYIDFSGHIDTASVRSESWTSVGGKVRNDEICLANPGHGSVK